MQQMSISYAYFFLLCGIAVFFMGWTEIFKKKIYGRRAEEYTRESVEKFSFYDGIICVIVGLSTAASQLSILYSYHAETFRLIGLLTVVTGILLDMRLSKRMLKKR